MTTAAPNEYTPIPNSVLPDANIWFSTTLHAWIGLLAAETLGSWSFYWTEDILAEAIYHKRREYPKTSSHQIEAIRDRLMTVMAENRITGFAIDESVSYSDTFDAHVHSAAIHGRIQIIVTQDYKDFAGLYSNSDDCPYEVFTPDEFLLLVAESVPEAIDVVIEQQFSYYMQKSHSFNLAQKLISAGCPHFAEYVRTRLQALSP
ncbi:hypothetical protein AY498_06655 [Corynebacterium ulcerans]|uniref:PIN domain-containing protein n=1 Tax=Corynebacterium ulcerans TaxID=65058 RepID=UPI000C7615CC|nr:PIN domain-containing protein [Corynebacterium ulcerans]PLW02554.1 hypothetical protein BRL54_05875 [Corynebacterium ulcerans]PME07032.1 hypothetical protein AY498_06655 [Corynebacterium ulcerans]